jgi:sulfoxide reductase heme-binding subunit YedZ
LSDTERAAGRWSRAARRVRNHVGLGAASLVSTAAIYELVQSKDSIFRASMATAYVALGLLGVTLAIGPLAALRGRRYPVSTDIRRDVGIWSGVVGLTHVFVGLQVHLRGKMWEYFVRPAEGLLLPRIDPFGAANYAGVVASLILLALLGTSNDASLRGLGTARWRSLHALTTWALVLTVLHGAAYQFVEKRKWPWVLLFACLALAAGGVRLARSFRRGLTSR